MRLVRSRFPRIRERGWHHATLTLRLAHRRGSRAPPVLGADSTRHRHFRFSPCTIDTGGIWQVDMMKNTSIPWPPKAAFWLRFWQEKGYTGPST